MLTLEIIGKADARAAGLTRYFTGKPCRRGHLAERVLSGNCVECARIAMAKHYPANRQKINERDRQRYLASPDEYKARARRYYQENTEKARAANLAWKIRNQERFRALQRAYSRKHSTRKVARAVLWRAENLERARVSQRARAWKDIEKTRMRARIQAHRRRKVGGRLSLLIVKILKERQHDRCACPCRRLLGRQYHIDHIIPLACGGMNADSNVQLLSPDCNRKKGVKNNEVFMVEQAKIYGGAHAHP